MSLKGSRILEMTTMIRDWEHQYIQVIRGVEEVVGQVGLVNQYPRVMETLIGVQGRYVKSAADGPEHNPPPGGDSEPDSVLCYACLQYETNAMDMLYGVH